MMTANMCNAIHVDYDDSHIDDRRMYLILSIDDRRMVVHFFILSFSGEGVKIHQQSIHISMPQYSR